MSASVMNGINETRSSTLNVDEAVRERYTRAARALEAALCCPVEYVARYLEVIPEEILERDYGCGDPSVHLLPGDVVLDLGSGGGKICYIASQVVGATGRVIGVDCNDEMLGLARKYQDEVARRLGWKNVDFRKGRIQDLRLDLDQFETWLVDHPIRSSADWLNAQEEARRQSDTSPMIPSESVDAVVSNCVLNLVRNDDRRQLFQEVHRVLKRGGRAIVSDIVCDEPVPERLRNDPNLWSGCISGAFEEHSFLSAFEDAGFYGIEILSRQKEPWAVVEGVEFRSVTVWAFKGKEGPCLERKQAVIYRGPWKAVIDDDGHRLDRSQRMAVCDKTFQIYSREPYSKDIVLLPPATEVPLKDAAAFDCQRSVVRSARETKGEDANATILPDADCCSPGGSCC